MHKRSIEQIAQADEVLHAVNLLNQDTHDLIEAVVCGGDNGDHSGNGDETFVNCAQTERASERAHKLARTDAKRSVAIVTCKELVKSTTLLPVHRDRSILLHQLLLAYRLYDCVTLVRPTPASREQLLEFHDPEYLKALSDPLDQSDGSASDENGLQFDCPGFQGGKQFNFDRHMTLAGQLDYVQWVAGASLTAAQLLNDKLCDIAINWEGYVNDIVLAILKLRESFERVLYVDIDVHHGDGVAEAFECSNSVFTLSLHCLAAGFFPGTGRASEQGSGRGLGYCGNVGLPIGTRDAVFETAFATAFGVVCDEFEPDVIVLQAGVDALAHDPLGAFELSAGCLVRCVKRVAKIGLPLLCLGGGGYHSTNAARCFARMTAALAETRLENDIPEHDFLGKYGPAFRLRNADDDSLEEKSLLLSNEQLPPTVVSALEQLTAMVRRETNSGL